MVNKPPKSAALLFALAATNSLAQEQPKHKEETGGEMKYRTKAASMTRVHVPNLPVLVHADEAYTLIEQADADIAERDARIAELSAPAPPVVEVTDEICQCIYDHWVAGAMDMRGQCQSAAT